MKNKIVIIVLVCVALIVLGILLLRNNQQIETIHAFQRWRNDINIDDVALLYGGKGVRIALIDTGVDTSHPDLVGANITTINSNITNTKDNNFEHGTAMAGIIVGNSASENGILGIAPKAELISINFSDKNSYKVEKLVDAISIAIENNVDIINISMGINENDKDLHEAIKLAYDRGIIIIAAAGKGENGEVLYPAKYDEVISVSALNKDGSLLFENIATDDITVFAPGKNIYTTYSSYESEEKYISADGSSPATAIVSGVIALVIEKNPNITSNDLFKYFHKVKNMDASKILFYSF